MYNYLITYEDNGNHLMIRLKADSVADVILQSKQLIGTKRIFSIIDLSLYL